MREQFEEAESISTGQTLAIFRQAIRYVAPFRRRFVVKWALVLLSLGPLLILPWPVKILVDHVIEQKPIAEGLQGFPFFVRPFVALLDGRSTVEILMWVTAVEALLVLLVGAMGVTGRERDQTDANLSSGHDTATTTENQANSGWSFAGGLLGLFDFRWTIRLTQALNHHYRTRLFERIQSLPMTAFDDERIGDAVYRVMYDTPSITEVVYRIILTPTVAPIVILATALILLAAYPTHPAIFWIALSFLPVVLIVTFPFGGAIRRLGDRSRKAGATTTSTVEEGMTNILAVQSLGGEERERARFDRDSWTSFGRHRSLVAVGMITFLVAFLLGGFVVREAFLYVANAVIAGTLTKGDFPVLMAYFAQLASYSIDLGALWIRIQAGAAGLHRVFFLMGLPAEEDPPGARPLPRVTRGVKIADASFAYDDGTQALHGASLEAKVGEITALVGPAGAGKTSLAYLIPRFVTPQSGTVEIDGVEVREVTRESLRRNVAFVFQENVLFDGTIEENIRLGRLDATELEVRRAAETAGAHEFIRDLPDGYQTRLGRAGGKLSVGQKQRLGIARALVRDAPILILDEPTSALDPDTERRLVASLRDASRTRLVIVIAHRLSTVRAADQILFLERGRIVERGSHAELMARPDGPYRHFVDLQTRGGDVVA